MLGGLLLLCVGRLKEKNTISENLKEYYVNIMLPLKMIKNTK